MIMLELWSGATHLKADSRYVALWLGQKLVHILCLYTPLVELDTHVADIGTGVAGQVHTIPHA